MKIPLSYLLILILMRMPLFGHAQNYYSDTSTFDRAAAFYTTLEVFYYGNITAFGGASDTTEVYYPNFLSNTKKSNGDTVFIFRETQLKTYFTRKSIRYGSNSIVVGYSSHVDSNNNVLNESFLFQLDSAGNILRFQQYPARQGATSFRFYDLTLHKGLICVLGFERRPVGSFNRFNLLVYILEPINLEVIRINEYGINHMDEFPGCIINSDRETMLVGANRTDFANSHNNNFQTWIFETDTAGNIIRQFFTSLPGRKFEPSAMKITSDGGLHYISIDEIYQASSNSYNKRATIAKLNAQLQLEWDSIYGQESHWVAPRDMVQKSDGRLYSCGEIGISSGTMDLYYGWLNAHTPTGGHLWQRFYLPFGDGEFEQGQLDAIRAHPDGGFVMAGQARAYGPSIVKAQHAWLLKVDSMGCLVPGCAVGIKELTPEPVYLKVWPNPAQGEAFVLYKSAQELPEAYLVLTDMLGRERRRAPVPETDAQYHLRLHNLEAGMYVVQLWHQGRLLAREKLMVQ